MPSMQKFAGRTRAHFPRPVDPASNKDKTRLHKNQTLGNRGYPLLEARDYSILGYRDNPMLGIVIIQY